MTRGNNTPQATAQEEYKAIMSGERYIVSNSTQLYRYMIRIYNETISRLHALHDELMKEQRPSEDEAKIRDYESDEFLTALTDAGEPLQKLIWDKLTESIADSITAEDNTI